MFRRTADIVPAFGHTVLGALYSITPADELALDRYEGVGCGRYRRETIHVNGQRTLVYVISSSFPEEAPSAAYYSLIEQGYQDWRLPINGLVTAREHVLERAQRHSA